MSTDVEAKTTIQRDREKVAAYAMDPRNDRSWIGGLTEVKALTDGPVRKGTQVERVAQFLEGESSTSTRSWITARRSDWSCAR
jgi:hypothetical protein